MSDDIPSVSIGSLEQLPGRVAEGARLFTRHGRLVVNGAFDPATLWQLNEAVAEGYAEYLHTESTESALSVGDKRTMVTVALAPPFNRPQVVANPVVQALLRELLGASFQLNSVSVVVARPGAKGQHVHRDHPGLFGEPIEALLPSHAVTVGVPLIPFTAEVGPARLWLGNHRMSCESARESPPVAPILPLGSAVLMDYRLVHGGGPNQSAQPRPILYLVYSRPWFRDDVNFEFQAPLAYGL